MQPRKFGDKGLAESCNRQGIFECEGHITNAKLNGVVYQMWTNVPPDIPTPLDKACHCQVMQIAIKIRPRGVNRGYTLTHESPSTQNRSIRFKACQAPFAERRG